VLENNNRIQVGGMLGTPWAARSLHSRSSDAISVPPMLIDKALVKLINRDVTKIPMLAVLNYTLIT
jgi:hypothetical protein